MLPRMKLACVTPQVCQLRFAFACLSSGFMFPCMTVELSEARIEADRNLEALRFTLTQSNADDVSAWSHKYKLLQDELAAAHAAHHASKVEFDAELSRLRSRLADEKHSSDMVRPDCACPPPVCCW